jgi:hypothetical protein
MLIKNVAIRQDWIEVFNESTVSAIGAAQVLAPSVQAERQNMREQTTVNFGAEQVLCVFPNVINFRPIAGTQPRKVAKMSIIVFESFLPSPVWRHRSCKGPAQCGHPISIDTHLRNLQADHSWEDILRAAVSLQLADDE